MWSLFVTHACEHVQDIELFAFDMSEDGRSVNENHCLGMDIIDALSMKSDWEGAKHVECLHYTTKLCS